MTKRNLTDSEKYSLLQAHFANLVIQASKDNGLDSMDLAILLKDPEAAHMFVHQAMDVFYKWR